MSDDIQQQAAPEVAVDTTVDTPIEGDQQQPGQQEGEQANADAQEAPIDRDDKGRFKGNGFQQRIDEVTRQRHEAEREAAYWRQRATAGEPAPGEQRAAEPAPKPTADKFDNYADYIEALTDWKTEQKVGEALSKRDAVRAQEAEGRVQQTKQQTFVERAKEARTVYTDYDTVVGASDAQIAHHVADVMLDSDKGADLAYHFAKNPDVLARLNTLSPTAAAREIGHIEATLQKPAPVTKSVSGAPEPIKPIGSGRTNAAGDPASMDMDQYMAHRAKQGARWAR